ncbi:MAG TPA: proline--tRNA ligase [Thermoguttaceae bacterium]|nr:proline--tRNA ligase [Thermoguttaceae bacterium]
MRWTQNLIPTMKETPEGAEIPSHVLMLRAGLVNQVMAGAYTYLPLGLRSLQKAQRIVREEMDAAGAVELLMPAITPLSLWEQTGRVAAFGDVLIQFTVRRQNRKVPMVLGPTHEEVITDLVSRFISSYRQMPVTLYQIQTKFRNEERPRFGVLRTSEFLMKDAYSFNTSVASLDESYEAMYRAYCRIFDRCGLTYLPVEAESGPIGGDASCEFMIPAENGEDTVAHCPACGYAANLERAEVGTRDCSPPDVKLEAVKKVATPQAGSIAQVTALLGCKAEQMIKTLIYMADNQPIAVLLRGDREANEGKIRRTVGAARLELAEPEVIQEVTGAPVGFAGPVGMAQEIPLWADRDLLAMRNCVTGANEADMHITGVNLGRDFQLADDHFADLRNACAGDPCPRCSSRLTLRHAIEVGHVFKLGTKYSEALAARFLDAQEQLHPIIMGCYGIGINRILAGLIETSHDKAGIIWPVSLAPYEVLLVPMKVTDEPSMKVTEDLYARLRASGVDVLLDDRDARPGVKFNDADLVGIPLRVVIGPRGLADGKLEIKWRWDNQPTMIDLAGAVEQIAATIRDERETGSRYLAGRATA